MNPQPAAYATRMVGDSAMLIELPDLDQVHGVTQWLRRQPYASRLNDVVPAPRTVLVVGAPKALTEVSASLIDLPRFDAIPRTGRTVEIDVVYDGPDLAEVCERTGLARTEFIAQHTGAEYFVAYFGFSPGHAYFASVPVTIQLPRRPSPRSRIPPDTVAMANEFTIIYPGGTPGGWNLIGTAVGDPLWDIAHDPPNLVELADRVVFRDAS